ncbi:hypothetical protein Q1695_016423 [Nippostrongylus brasiliensis]|nr:hypothetical protein Q1695_016423 [Nippostrongylus brasiliensis]
MVDRHTTSGSRITVVLNFVSTPPPLARLIPSIAGLSLVANGSFHIFHPFIIMRISLVLLFITILLFATTTEAGLGKKLKKIGRKFDRSLRKIRDRITGTYEFGSGGNKASPINFCFLYTCWNNRIVAPSLATTHFTAILKTYLLSA